LQVERKDVSITMLTKEERELLVALLVESKKPVSIRELVSALRGSEGG
jgi:hypothetical protein